MKFDQNGYTLTATENYQKGEEVYMSYGCHPNDFLMAECEIFMKWLRLSCRHIGLMSFLDGFFLDNNESDCIYLDDIIFRDIDPWEEEKLHACQYYGYAENPLQMLCPL